MKKLLLIAVSLLVTLSSCSTVYFQFDKESPDIVPDDKNFYNGVKTYSIQTANQNVVYNSQELTSDVNVAISTIENEFIKHGLKVTKGHADVIIELVSVDRPAYTTNKVYKTSNDKAKKYPDCQFSFYGLRIYLKAVKGDDFVNYTFYHTPCADGECEFRKIKHCDKIPLGSDNEVPAYELNAKNNPKNVELIARLAANNIIGTIKANKQ